MLHAAMRIIWVQNSEVEATPYSKSKGEKRVLDGALL